MLEWLMVLAFGCLLVGSALRDRRRARQVEDTPSSKSQTASQGHGEFQGFAWPKSRGFIMVNGESAVFYSFALQKQVTRGSGKNRRTEWETQYTYAFTEPFYLLDPTGLVEIHTLGADLSFSQNRTRLWWSLNKEEKRFYSGTVVQSSVSGFPPSTFLFGIFGSKFRIIESYMLAGSPVLIHGDFQTLGSPKTAMEVGLTDFATKVIDFEARKFKNVNRNLDVNGDGKVTEVEAREGLVKVAHFAQQKSTRLNVGEREFPVHGVLQSTENHKLFIADAHQNHLVKRLRRFQNLRIGVGVLVIAGTLSFGLLRIRLPATIERQPAAETVELKSAGVLHRECANRVLGSCVHLLTHVKQFHLKPEHIRYYEYQACHAGDQSRCSSAKY